VSLPSSKSVSVTAYDTDVKVVTELRVPGQPTAVLLVRYFSWAFEHGYTRDLAMSVPLTKAQVRAFESLSAVDYDPYARFPELTDGV